MEGGERLVFRIATPWFWWTIYDPGQQWTLWRILNIVLFVMLSPVIVVAALAGGFLSKPSDRSPDEVARYLLNEAHGESGFRDWDDFIGIPIADPRLDAIRTEAARLPCPLNQHREELLALIEQARQLK